MLGQCQTVFHGLLGDCMSKILFVDDEGSILKAARRCLALHDMDVLTAGSGREALELFKTQDISVLITDQRMPEMTGTELVEKVRHLSPETVRIILSGYTDLSALLEAINNGKIFRFMVKPWQDDELLKYIDEALEQYQLNLRNRQQEEQMLLALAQTIELKDPYTKGHCERVARFAVEISRALGLPEDQIKEIRYGAWLHDCGKIGLHEDILNFPGRVDEEQMDKIRKHPEDGATIAEQAALPTRVANIIRYHHERVDGTGYPKGLKRHGIPIEAKIVAVADVYDAISSDRPYHKACTEEKAREIMTGFRGCSLEEELVDLFMDDILPRLKQQNVC